MAIINGTPGDDSLGGTNDDDIIFGGEGNDKIEGFEGRDSIIGVDHTELNPGEGERDTLIARGDGDILYLGINLNPYYRDFGLGLGTEGFAAIHGFQPGDDRIRIDPNSDYAIMDFAVPGYGGGAGIFYVEETLIGDQRLDLVGLVIGVDPASLTIAGDVIS